MWIVRGAARRGVALALTLPGPLRAVGGNKNPFAAQGVVAAMRMEVRIKVHVRIQVFALLAKERELKKITPLSAMKISRSKI